MKRARARVAAMAPIEHADAVLHARPGVMVHTIAAGVMYRQTLDNHMIDRLHRAAQITDDQYEAAQRLLEMAGAAGILLGSSGGWSGGGRAEMSDEMAEAHKRWWNLMRDVGALRAELLTGLMHERHPGVARLATVQSALEWLFQRWGMGPRAHNPGRIQAPGKC